MYVGDQDILVASSEFWGPSVMSDQGMRVNCEAPSALVSRVRIRSRANEGLSISEIEVHTLGKFFTNNNVSISMLSCLHDLSYMTLS